MTPWKNRIIMKTNDSKQQLTIVGIGISPPKK
jgi:hypothetical protein